MEHKEAEAVLASSAQTSLNPEEMKTVHMQVVVLWPVGLVIIST